MTEQELAEIEARAREATEGPWRRVGATGMWRGPVIIFGDPDPDIEDAFMDWHPLGDENDWRG